MNGHSGLTNVAAKDTNPVGSKVLAVSIIDLAQSAFY